MIEALSKFLSWSGPDLDKAEREVERRRNIALEAIRERQKCDPAFRPDFGVVCHTKADAETAALIRGIAGYE